MPPSTDSAVVELVLTVGDREYRQKLGEDGALLKKFGGDAKVAGEGATSLVGKLTAMRAGIAGLGGALAAAKIGSFIYDTASSFERLNAQLLTSEKTQARAQIAFDRIREFAATTPYELEQVTEAYIKLRNLGLDPSIKALTAYGNIAGGMGKSLNQVIEAVADASTFEFERLKEFGIKASQQGDKVRFTFQGVTTTVAKNAADIERYLQNIGEVNFAGGMERQAKTLEGVASNLGDAFAALAIKVDSKTGFTGAIKTATLVITELLNQIAGVPRSLDAIEAQIAASTARLGGASGDERASLSSSIEKLQKERLDKLLGSSDPALLQKGIDELKSKLDVQRTIVERARAQFRETGPTGLPAASKRQNDIEFQLALAMGRQKNLARADGEAAAELAQRKSGQAEQAAIDRREKEAKAREKLLKAEEQMAFNEAKRMQELLEADEKRTDELKKQIALRREAAGGVLTRANRTLDLQGYGAEDQQRIGQLQDLADKFDEEQEKLDAFYAGQLERQQEYQEASLALRLAYRVDEAAINRASGEDAVKIDAETKAILLAQGAGFASDALGLAQALAGESQSLRIALLAFEKTAAIAEIFIQTQLGAAKAVGQAGPFGIPLASYIEGLGYARMALVAGTGLVQASQISRSRGGGRQFGGDVEGGRIYPFMEAGEPELIRTRNGQFYLGVPGGGRVSPAQEAGGKAAAAAPAYTVVNNAPGLVLTPRQNGLTIDMLPELLEQFASTTEARIVENTRRGRGVAPAIGARTGAPQRQSRSLA